ncbi:MAG: carbon storage regulator [Thermoguttaceae bacterium]|nr:carbon storage regulator [Thermoguttaceae bacterium]
MLVLSRKKGESVVVNGNITIVVVDIRGDKTRIGIEAPADVAVYRSEVLAKSATANESDEAAQDGEIVASQTSRKKKKVDETQKRGKSKGGRGARKKTVATIAAVAPIGENDQNGENSKNSENSENAVETLYLSSESEAYRRSDAVSDAANEASSDVPKGNERDAENAGRETVDAENGAK